MKIHMQWVQCVIRILKSICLCFYVHKAVNDTLHSCVEHVFCAHSNSHCILQISALTAIGARSAGQGWVVVNV